MFWSPKRAQNKCVTIPSGNIIELKTAFVISPKCKNDYRISSSLPEQYMSFINLMKLCGIYGNFYLIVYYYDSEINKNIFSIAATTYPNASKRHAITHTTS